MKALLGKSTISIMAGLFLLLAAASAAKADTHAQIRQTCRADIEQYCRSAIGGGKEKMRSCIRENAPRFSRPCRDALRAAWSARAAQQARDTAQDAE